MTGSFPITSKDTRQKRASTGSVQLQTTEGHDGIMTNQIVAFVPLPCERRNDLVNKLLQLGDLVGPNKTDAQIGHAGGLIALQRVDD